MRNKKFKLLTFLNMYVLNKCMIPRHDSLQFIYNVYSNFLRDYTSVQRYDKFYVQTLPLFALDYNPRHGAGHTSIRCNSSSKLSLFWDLILVLVVVNVIMIITINTGTVAVVLL